MSKQESIKRDFLDSDNNDLHITNHIELFTTHAYEYDFNNSDLTSEFSLSIDTMIFN